MPMNIIIREKRKELGLTQEQVADYLGVSTPAVNKWEKGATYPDISLLPALSRLLKVDLNTLFCFNDGLSAQEIGHFLNEVIATIRKNGFESGFSMSIEKIREYPNCDALIHSTASLLDGTLLMFGAGLDNKEPYENQITAMYERAAKSDDELIRNKAIFMLASKYMGHIEYDKAQEMLDLLPERTALDKRQLQANLLVQQGKLAEAEKLLEHKLLSGVNEIQIILMSLVDIELKADNHKEASHLAALCQEFIKLFDLWDYSSFVPPLQVALAQENVQDSLSLLKSMLSAVLAPWDVKQSSLYRHIAVNPHQENFVTQILPAILSELENSPQYEFLRSNAEFQQLTKQYRGTYSLSPK